MNKKLKKGLTTTMAAAMGLGVVIPAVPVIAAPATSGWVKTAAGWTYLKSGVKATGWVKDGGAWYFLDSNGVMKTGWVKDAGTWYYLNASGAMVTGWFKDADGSWYFLKTSGAMAASTWVGNYYLGASGAMLTSTVTPDGYTVDANGAWDGKPANTTPVETDLKVSSVSANSAKSMKVTFNTAVKDTTKVTFAVAGSAGAAVTTTVTWNTANTEAVLTTSYNLTPDTYSVSVKNDTTDLGSSSVAITQQQAAKIQITSSVLAIDPISGNGYVTYKVYDQYGVDITNTTLGNDISWTPGIGQYSSHKNGTLIIAPNGSVPLSTYVNTNAVINGYDTDNYITTSATLTVQQTGTLGAITLNNLTSPNNDDFNAGNASGLWYLDFTALDASGNQTTDYNLINAGIQSVNVGGFLTLVAGGNGVEQDPNDSSKAAIPVQVNTTAATSLAADTPVPITIITKSGKSSTLTVTLKKAASLNSFTLSAPSTTVADGDTVTLPFTAYDQNSTALKNYSDLVNTSTGTPKVTISLSQGTLLGNGGIIRNADGTASIQFKAPSVPSGQSSTTVYVQSNVTLTGKSSSLAITVQKPAVPDSLSVTTADGKVLFQNGATEKLDFGLNYGGMSLNDQYGRAIDLTNVDSTGTHYEVIATAVGSGMSLVGSSSDAATTTMMTTGASPVAVTGYRVYNDKYVKLTAAAAGVASVKYEVYSVNAAGTLATDTGIGKTVQYTVLNPSDVTGYTLTPVTNPIYVDAATTGDALGDYAGAITLYGTTAGGAKVRVNPANIVTASVDNPTNFALSADGISKTLNSFTSSTVYAYAKSATGTDTTEKTNVTVVAKDANGNYVSVTTPVSSTTAAPVVSSIDFTASNSTGVAGISASGNTVTVDTSKYANVAAALAALSNDELTYIANTGSYTTSPIYFSGNDQYGTTDAPINTVAVSNTSSGFAGTTIASNKLSFGAATPVAGDWFVLTAVSANGKIQTIKVVLK